MQMLSLSHIGTDRVTFWTTPKSPEGCFIQYPGEMHCYGVVSILHQGKSEPVVGLFQMFQNLYSHLIQELEGGYSLADIDIDFVSDATSVYALFLPGGAGQLPSEVQKEMAELEAAIHQKGGIR